MEYFPVGPMLESFGSGQYFEKLIINIPKRKKKKFSGNFLIQLYIFLKLSAFELIWGALSQN